MKVIKLIMSAAMAFTLGTNSFAHTNDNFKMVMTKTETIKVLGNCEMCKARIEKAAKIESVSNADWSIKTKMLTLIYDRSKVISYDFQRSIAVVGHNTPRFKANNKVYNALPNCCKYRN